MNNDVNNANNSNETTNTEINIDVHSAPIDPTQTAPVESAQIAPQPEPAPVTEVVQPEQVTQTPAPESVQQPVQQPEPQPAPEPAPEPAPQPVSQPIAQPQVQAQPQPVQQPVVQGPIIASPNTPMRKNFYQGFNANNNANKNKKKVNIRLAFDLILLAVVVCGALYIVLPRDEGEVGGGPEVIDIRNLDSQKTECYESALKYVKLKYDFEPELTDIAIESDMGSTEYCTLKFYYKEKEFNSVLFTENDTIYFFDNYQYDIILNYVTKTIKEGIGIELYAVELEISSLNQNLNTLCPNCLSEKANTANLFNQIAGSHIYLYLQDKDYDENEVKKYINTNFYGSSKLNFHLFSYKEAGRAKKNIRKEIYKEYYLDKEAVISVPSGTNKYDFTEYDRFDTYQIEDVFVVFYGKRLANSEDPTFVPTLISETKDKRCYKLEYNGFGTYKNVDKPNFSLYSENRKDITIQNTQVIFQAHETADIYYSVNRFVIYSDYSNFSIDMCIMLEKEDPEEEEEPEEIEEEEKEEEEEGPWVGQIETIDEYNKEHGIKETE